MGSITERATKKGRTYFAQANVTITGRSHRTNKTFERRPDAVRWVRETEAAIKAAGGLVKTSRNTATLGDALDAYLKANAAGMGRTKLNTLKTIRRDDICDIECAKVTSIELREFMDRRVAIGNSPATVGNYLSHLSSVFKIAEDGYGFPLNYEAIIKAQRVGRAQDQIMSSGKRERLPTLDELDRILTYFEAREREGDTAYPLVKIVVFALFSTRRSAEISRIRWADLDRGDANHPPRVLVRDMKNPGRTKGNDTWCILTDPAMRIVESMPITDDRIFPWDGKTVGSYWTDACKELEIADLHFHDLRHAGVTRLAEMGQSDKEMRAVSGHRGAASLLRYSHYRRTGDRFTDWPWIERAIRGHA